MSIPPATFVFLINIPDISFPENNRRSLAHLDFLCLPKIQCKLSFLGNGLASFQGAMAQMFQVPSSLPLPVGRQHHRWHASFGDKGHRATGAAAPTEPISWCSFPPAQTGEPQSPFSPLFPVTTFLSFHFCKSLPPILLYHAVLSQQAFVFKLLCTPKI